MSEVATDIHSVRCRDAVLALGVSDVSGLKTAASLLIDGGTKIPFLEPSIGVSGARDGIHARMTGMKASIPRQPRRPAPPRLPPP